MALRRLLPFGSLSASTRIDLVAAALAWALASLVGLVAPAQAAGSYTFAGLQWGMSADDAVKALRGQGFKVGKPTLGPADEYAAMNMWLEVRRVDRGKRLKATGKFQGEPVEVDLVFGTNDQLERVHLRAPLWDGTMPGAKRMAASGQKLLAYFEHELGRASKKYEPFSFVDTAQFAQAQDGSNMEMYIRGREGFMFFPKHMTALVFNFWNDKYRSSLPAMASKESEFTPVMKLKHDNLQ